MALPSVSIIILTKNAGKRLKAVLDGVFSNIKAFDAEVLIVDSGSTDETKGIISGYPARFIEIGPDSFGHGKTRNLGAREARGEVLVYLTQDAIPCNKEWLSTLVANLNAPGVAGAFGRQLPEEGSSPIERFYLSYLYPGRRIVRDSLDPGNCLLKDMFFSNVNSAILKCEWEKRKFNEQLIMSEDQEWSRAVLLAGRKIVYDPQAAVFHSHKYTLKQLITRNFDSGVSLRKLVSASLGSSLRYEMNYLAEGMRFFAKNNSYASMILFPFYELVRLLSFALGFHSSFLPLFIKKLLSQHKYYWFSGNSCQKGPP